MKIEVGKSYIDGCGCEIVIKGNEDVFFIDDYGNHYDQNGVWVSQSGFPPNKMNDLVEEIKPNIKASKLYVDVGNPKNFSTQRFETMIAETWDAIMELVDLKGGEYSGDDDRLANFRRNGADLELPMETVWRVYAAKHWDAISQYIKDLQQGKSRERMESLDGRVDDLIVYLLLFKAMIEEKEGEN